MSTFARAAGPGDADAVRAVHLAAFPQAERAIIAAFAARLLLEPTTPPTLNLVAEVDGEVVAHVAFSPVSVAGDAAWRGCILAPVGVGSDWQGQGLGSGLIEQGLAKLRDAGAHVVFVYGDPDYYQRFGFTAALASGFVAPYPLAYPFGWQALVLEEGRAFSEPVEIACVPALQDPALW